MSAWDAYPDDYRAAEVQRIMAAVRAGECVSVVGLSGAGKSNLMGFLFHRVARRSDYAGPALVLLDGNQVSPARASEFFQQLRQALGTDRPERGVDERGGLWAAVHNKLGQSPGGLCLVVDRYDVLNQEEQAQTYGPLRALRDAFKYQLSYVIATRRPLAASNEMAELFYAQTLWLGPLSKRDALWSALNYAERRNLKWDVDTVTELVTLSQGYPSLLRACCEAYADGCALEYAALASHPAVERRVREFWNDAPSREDVRLSGLANHPLLDAAHPEAPAAPDLTAGEHRLLSYLQTHAGQICSKDDLVAAVWPDEKQINGLRDDSLAQLIRRLRVKIGAERIETIPGRGYRYPAGRNAL